MSKLSRRGLLAAVSALAVLPLKALAFALPKPPPAAKLTPATDTFFGISLTDPYRWMESQEKDPDWIPYMQAQDGYARGLIKAIPGRDAFAKRIAALSGEISLTRGLSINGPYVFLYERPAGANSYRLVVREGMTGPSRVLIDPNTETQDGAHISLDWWKPSDDGRHVVYGLSRAGSEDSVIHVMETATGKVLPDRIPRAQYATPAWLPDGSGFAYNQLGREGSKPSDADYFLRSRCLIHKLGTDPKDDVFVFGQGYQAGIKVEDKEFPTVFTWAGSDHALAVLIPGVAPEWRIWITTIQDLAGGKPNWKPVAEAADQVTTFALDGDDLYLQTFKDAPRYKVLKTSARAPDLAKATVAVPQGERVLQGIVQAKEGLYLVEMDGGVGRVRRRGRDGRMTEIALPLEGTLTPLYADPTREGFWVSSENYVTPLSIYRIDASGKAVDTRLTTPPPYDLKGFRQTRMVATVRDGTRVPLTVIHRPDAKKSGDNIVLLDAYGAYGSNVDPYFSPRLLPFVEAGGMLVTIHARGGGEYGREWHLAGQKATKANTWRDVIDAAEYLIKEGWTKAGKISVEGTSAGGIMAANCLTERPDLWAVVYNRVGTSNAYRESFAPGGPANFDEFGDPNTEAGFKALAGMDAYYRIKDGVKYPAVLATSGMKDPRVPPWQGAKFSERVRAASSSGKPVVLRVEFEGGHGIGSTRQQLDEEFADAFAFIFWQSGDPRYQVK